MLAASFFLHSFFVVECIKLLIFVMRSTLCNFYLSVLDAIYKAVCLINVPAPKALVFMFEWFRFSDTVITVTVNVLQQLINPFQCLSVLSLPEEIFAPGSI